MRILFNAMNCGLGNNGGSSTIVNSANTLVELGHDVKIIDSQKNKFTWVPLKAEHIIIRNLSKVPPADAVIATGYKTVASTMKLPDECGVKCHWIRAWEHWQMSDKDIIKKVLEPPTKKFVNSKCLQDKLRNYGFKSYIVRPGYDFRELFPLNIRDTTGKRIILGGLYREGVHGERKRTKWVLNVGDQIRRDIKSAQLWMLGSEKNPNIRFVDKYFRAPSPEVKRQFYNSVNVWLAPTMSEGLHMPPAEAMLTECPVVGTNAELSGMQDYLINDKTGIVSKNDYPSFFYAVKRLIKSPKRATEFGKNGRLRILELGTRRDNMMGLVNILEMGI